jgi:spore coat polysaccharide biosynthesis protein SpsF (cytidylyltransferase family)
MKSAVFLSVREKATRLPKKVLLEIKGKSVTEHLIDRLKTARLPDMIVLCTSVDPRDAILVEIAKKCNIPYFTGSEDDKLDRYLQAARRFGVDFMVIVDGDDIFCDPGHIDKTIAKFQETNADFIYCPDLPLGAASSGIKLEALKKVCEIKAENDTEVWGGYFLNTGLFKIVKLEVEDEELRHPEVRMTLDYQEDFEFFKAVFEGLYEKGRVFTLKEIMMLLKEHPEILDLNKSVQEAYLQNLKKHTNVKIKQQ